MTMTMTLTEARQELRDLIDAAGPEHLDLGPMLSVDGSPTTFHGRDAVAAAEAEGRPWTACAMGFKLLLPPLTRRFLDSFSIDAVYGKGFSDRTSRWNDWKIDGWNAGTAYRARLDDGEPVRNAQHAVIVEALDMLIKRAD